MVETRASPRPVPESLVVKKGSLTRSRCSVEKPRSTVLQNYVELAFAPCRVDSERPGSVNGLERVCHQVVKGPIKEVLVAHDGHVVAVLPFNGHAELFTLRFHEHGHLFEDGAHIDREHDWSLGSGVIQKFGDGAGKAFGLFV